MKTKIKVCYCFGNLQMEQIYDTSFLTSYIMCDIMETMENQIIDCCKIFKGNGLIWSLETVILNEW